MQRPHRGARRWTLPAQAMLLLAVTPLAAQEGFPRPVPGPLSESAVPIAADWGVSHAAADTAPRRLRPSHWGEGALIGGGIMGLFTGALMSWGCDWSEGNSPHHCITAGNSGVLAGVIFGGVPGALIGSLFPKPFREPGDVKRGHKGTLGALAFGIPTTILTISGMRYYCRGPRSWPGGSRSCPTGDVAGALLVGALNTGVGYLLGRTIPKWGPPPP